jgi:hypothetical protein
MRKLIFGFICALFATQAQAAPITLNVEPLVGYERVQKLIPTAHSKDRLMYGGRVSIGIPLLSVETEYTRGVDNETFIEQGLSIKDTDDKVKLGARSMLRMSRFFSLIGRGGVQGKWNTHEETVAGVTTKTSNPAVYKPYAGAGLAINIGSMLVVSGGLTAVFNNFPDMNQNEYQTHLGFTVRLKQGR